MTHPALIGYTWYKFRWNPVALDEPNYGLIDSTGREGPFSSPLLREVNARFERIALGEIAPATRLGETR